MERSPLAVTLQELIRKPQGYELTEALFVRLLGLVYLAAFASWWPQMTGLYGAGGIVPIAQILPAIRAQLGASAYYEIPTLFWLNSSNAALVWCCIAGSVSALLLLTGIFSRPAVIVCWVLYLSIVSIGAPFSNFQWDALLL